MFGSFWSTIATIAGLLALFGIYECVKTVASTFTNLEIDLTERLKEVESKLKEIAHDMQSTRHLDVIREILELRTGLDWEGREQAREARIDADVSAAMHRAALTSSALSDPRGSNESQGTQESSGS